MIILLCLLCLLSCALDYEQVNLARQIADDVPTSVFVDFSHVVVRDSLPVFKVTAGQASYFAAKNQTVMVEVDFKEYDRDGKTITSGRCERAVLFTDTEDVELKGSLDFYSSEQEARLESDYLYWHNEASALTSRESDAVRITRDSGAWIMGNGFSAGARDVSVSYGSEIQGIWVDEEEKENADSDTASLNN